MKSIGLLDEFLAMYLINRHLMRIPILPITIKIKISEVDLIGFHSMIENCLTLSMISKHIFIALDALKDCEEKQV